VPLTSPAGTLGVVGGGQLGRMMAEAASPLGVEVVVLDPTPRAPASAVARDQIEAAFDDPQALEELAKRSDWLTYEIELADPEALTSAAEARGLAVHPRPATLALIEDKLVQKRELADAGVPVPAFREAGSVDQLREALDELGCPAMLKARTGGYDGRGNVPIEDPTQAEQALDAVGGDAMVEAFVDFERELSVIACQGEGERAFFPVTETIHEAEILRETVTPARCEPPVAEQAREVADRVLDLVEGRGVYGIEMFETREGEVLLNEIAPRPHNSGHWTIEGALTSQFEQHVRAVTGRPLGTTELREPTVSANLLGDVDEPRPARLQGVERVLADDRAKLHWYGKREARPLRKMGHLTLSGPRNAAPGRLLDRARDLRDAVTLREP
jgi:5-(carboxyamino)imidazole ribonucleotide synthase